MIWYLRNCWRFRKPILRCLWGIIRREDRGPHCYNLLIGPGAGANLTRGRWNICIGPDAGWKLTTEDGQIRIRFWRRFR